MYESKFRICVGLLNASYREERVVNLIYIRRFLAAIEIRQWLFGNKSLATGELNFVNRGTIVVTYCLIASNTNPPQINLRVSTTVTWKATLIITPTPKLEEDHLIKDQRHIPTAD